MACTKTGFIGIVASLCLVNCAGTTVRPITADADSSADGIRYYEAAPFLLVYTDGKGGLVSELKFLPDTTSKRSVDPFAVLAQNSSTLTFTNGVLSQSKTVVDETTVPKAIVTALEKAAAAAMGAANAPGQPLIQTTLPLPRLYRIVITKIGVSLVGGKVFSADNIEINTIGATINPLSPGESSSGEDDGKKDDQKKGKDKQAASDKEGAQ